ncbi:twin-arginine translocation pathway signal [Ketogulonicigenium robustum]|uniref:Thiamine pyrimidine synthase n=1 Tax=Ketogulonicigenium robustum TaxID=92947 RepID=A0A1W6NVZ8_9RHOB|nr:ABC transporter substrate-binding protein [Ketogulonicigenium robustum]ARO13395.1 twin-arginine translocation pathway signal [Ketogulonicigenium robustum]
MLSPSLSRRHFIANSCAGLAFAASLRPAFAQNNNAALRTALNWLPNVQYAGFWVALERGYFAEEGIDPIYFPGGPNAPNSLVTLAADGADLGMGLWLPFLDARARGNDMVMLGANFPNGQNGFISLPGKPIVTPADLVGARILGQTESDKQIIETMLIRAGLPLDYHFVPAGFSPEPLLAGDGDAYICFVTNQPITLENLGLKQGTDFLVHRFDEFGYRAPNTIFISTREKLEANRDRYVRYLRALARGWQENEKDPEFAASLVVNNYGADLGLDLVQQTRQNELQIALVQDATGRYFGLAPDDIASGLYDLARSSGKGDVLPDDPTVLYDFSILDEALASL